MVDQYFVKVDNFSDFARFVCASREYPLRVYAFSYKGKKIFSSRKVLPNSILHFYTDFTKDGRYISYKAEGGKEIVAVVNSTKKVSSYAPIVKINSLPFPIKTVKRIKDKFKPIKVHSLGDLARLSYNPEFPDESELTLYCFPHKRKWLIGYLTGIELDEKVYCFNYVELDKEPKSSFIKYSGHEGSSTEFSNKLQHGFHYLPVIKLKQSHPIFGVK